jgi:hypothetical protein
MNDDEEEEQEDSDDDEVLMLVTSAVQCNAHIPVIALALMQQAEQHSWRRSRRRRPAQETGPRILRNPTLFDERLKWDVFIRRFGGRAEFKRHLRMSSDSFTKLLSHIRPSLEVDAEMARRRGGQIHPELCLYACLRFLAGGSYSDLRFFTGMELHAIDNVYAC